MGLTRKQCPVCGRRMTWLYFNVVHVVTCNFNRKYPDTGDTWKA